jgi:hypothetical protein
MKIADSKNKDRKISIITIIKKYIKVENYDGIGSSLGNSLMSAKEYLNIPLKRTSEKSITFTDRVNFSKTRRTHRRKNTKKTL